MPVTATHPEFIEKLKAVHGYKYSAVTEYAGSKILMTFNCPEHGNFQLTPNAILRNRKCPSCGPGSGGVAVPWEEALAKLRARHPNLMFNDYEPDYKNSQSKVSITCAEHGTHLVKVATLNSISGCPKCAVISGNLKRQTTFDTFVAKASEVHNGKFTYVRNSYTKASGTVGVVCPNHGEFYQDATSHLMGAGCRKCYSDARREIVIPFAEFLDRARKVHGDTYDYIPDEYSRISDTVTVVCRTHGRFYPVAADFVRGSTCPSCAATGSKGQKELTAYLQSLGLVVIENYCYSGRKQVDCYLPELKIAVEYDGLFWHSTANKVDNYQKVKRAELEGLGIKLIRIFEDEWKFRNVQVKSLLASRAGRLTATKIAARKCLVVDVSNTEATAFYESNHVQGWRTSAKHKGLTYNGELVAVMSFTTRLSNRGVKSYGEVQELARFATSCQVVGGAGKLFKALVAYTGASTVVSYSDNRLFSGGLYPKLGFTMVKAVPPSYTYIAPGGKHRLHKSQFRRSKLPAIFGSNFNPSLSERENCERNGHYQVYDCGLQKWVWSKPQT